MPDDGGSLEKGPPAVGRRERRSVPRFSLFAAAKEVDVVTRTELSGAVSEISEKGCFIDTLNPFPTDTTIEISIEHHEQVFHAIGRVVYVIPNMGMGVLFTTIDNNNAQILKNWLHDCL